MIDRGAIVRFACMKCRTVLDVDLHAVALVRGRSVSLLGATAQCKISTCRGHGHFVYSSGSREAFLMLVDAPETVTPSWLRGLRPCDVEAPDDPPPRSPAAASLPRRACA